MKRQTILMFILLLVSSPYAAAQSGTDEYQVKAAFLYNFVKFIDWPPSSAPVRHIHIGIVGNGPAADAVEGFVKGRTAAGRDFVTRRLKWDEPLRGFHILFVSELDSKKVQRVLDDVAATGTLTVGDLDGFGEQGGMINFFVKDARVRFEINTDSTSAAGFKISARLLSLAKPVSHRHPADKKP